MPDNGYIINYIIDKMSFPVHLFILRHFSFFCHMHFSNFCPLWLLGMALQLVLLLTVYTFPGCTTTTAATTMASNVLQQIRSLIYAKTCFELPPEATARRPDKQTSICIYICSWLQLTRLHVPRPQFHTLATCY